MGFAVKGARRNRVTAHPQTPHNPNPPNRFAASGMRQPLEAIAPTPPRKTYSVQNQKIFFYHPATALP